MLSSFGGPVADARPVVELAEPAALPPAELAAECPRPIDLPPGPMNRGEALRRWARDRAALASCGARHAAQTRFYRERDAALAGR